MSARTRVDWSVRPRLLLRTARAENPLIACRRMDRQSVSWSRVREKRQPGTEINGRKKASP